ncbi:MAG: RluA family pseudouridine synthase [Sphaerochaeta sp.]
MGVKDGRIELVVSGVGDEKKRLDAYVGQATTSISRSTLSDERTCILLNGKSAKKSKPVRDGDVIVVTYAETFFEGLKPQQIELDVLYEDADLLVINKKQGMVVHPGAGNTEDTVVNALLYRYGENFADELNGSDDDEEPEPEESAVRPGIVHRLDKDTSGVLVIARNRAAHRHLSDQFKERTTRKVYIAVAKGRFSQPKGVIEAHLKRDSADRKRFTTCGDEEGRTAKTEYQVLRQYTSCALLRIVLHTGRTHQIRVHLKSIAHPLVGDPIYGKEDGQTLMLHALELEVESPSTGIRIRCKAPLPSRFSTYLRATPRPSSAPVRSR